MKQIYKIGATLMLSSLFMSSCSNFLDSSPMTTITDQNYYKTPTDGATALTGCYSGLQSIWNAGVALPVLAEIQSDNCYGGTGNGDGHGYQMLYQFDPTVSPSDISIFDDNWKAYYAGLDRCNTLISKMSQIDWGADSTSMHNCDGEARFIRAYLYFDLVRMFQNVPLLTESTAANVKQADPKDVYTQIAKDLKFAISNCSTTPYPMIDPTTYGHANKYAAEAMLARVYLFYTGYYGQTTLDGLTKANVLAYTEDVIKNSGYGLLSDYNDLFQSSAESAANEGRDSSAVYAGEDNQETVFSIKYTYTGDYNGNKNGNCWMIMEGVRGTGMIYYPYGYGWGACTVEPKLWNAFNPNDARQQASIISMQAENIPMVALGDAREYTGYYLKKYSPLCDKSGTYLPVAMGGVNEQMGQFEDYVVMRYSDVLLMAAELGSANAQTYFDTVRKRALGAKFTSLPVNKTNIMNERRLEFVGEGIRYYDLLRQGINVAAQTLAEDNSLVQNGGLNATVTIKASRVIATGGFNQIPSAEITLSNGYLVQNPGW